MKNARIDIYKLFLLIIIFTTPYIVLAQENETKISSSENITKPLYNGTVSESLSKSDNAKEDNTIKLLLLGNIQTSSKNIQ